MNNWYNDIDKIGECSIDNEDFVAYSDGSYSWAVPVIDWDRRDEHEDYQAWCDSSDAVRDVVLCSRIAHAFGASGIYASGSATWCPAYDADEAPRFAVIYDPADWGTIAGVGATAEQAQAQADQWIDEQIVDEQIDEEPQLSTVCFELTESARYWLATHNGDPIRWDRADDGKLDIEIDCREV